MKKENIYFNHAYKAATGKLYDWEERGDPMDADSFTKGFYQGFMLANKAYKLVKRENRDLLEALNDTQN